ncbi:hypothetical protein RIF29_39503 [Crotalaria pallida]|uniref:Uncharacterized protein n=1 Tax=Crotalaria pallida TaxID=3830 RepID=A0AAN9E1D7_CROPI
MAKMGANAIDGLKVEKCELKFHVKSLTIVAVGAKPKKQDLTTTKEYNKQSYLHHPETNCGSEEDQHGL